MKGTRPVTVIIDYGMGNLFSLERVIRYLGGIAVVSSDSEAIASAERVILPGVGAFGDGMDKIRKMGLIAPILKVIDAGKPFLGICLGMQLLMTESEEFGRHRGLDIISGSVRRFLEPENGCSNYKIPHVGWNRLLRPVESSQWQSSILSTTVEGEFVYFVHSYTVVSQRPEHILAETEYGQRRFCSVIRSKNVFGCQFHPEVSANVGLRILKEFLYAV
ncbi:MAG: imidazole glycerol phosphate synthase subunit HisH [Candidatus Omnitrophica bacterium]|nr:imidazole glycerol phosphate synthase subunit HisH [Candidatus Omnitrophota bacterium]MBU2265990.1 imidazole glycerol phosphate synthase subunit HisH [Candidatus Omnitrophota bacterium]